MEDAIIMKILMVSETLTHPTQMGNQQRIYRECIQMRQRGWQVDFLYYGNAIGKNVDQTRDFFGEAHFFQYFKGSYTTKAQIKKKIRDYMDYKGISRYIALKYSADEWYTNEIENKLRDLLHNGTYDVVWFQYFFQTKVLDSLKDISVLKVIDTHDKWANRNRIYQKMGKVPENIYTSVRGERRALKRADIVIAIQEKENEYFKKLLKGSSTKVLTIGDLVEERKAEKGQNYIYGMIGAENRPNILGMEWFCAKVLPIVLEKCPQSKCMIAGGICKCISDYPGIYKMGRVDLLEDFYDLVKVAINPIQNGTGLNIKTIEALAFGKPLITTRIGAKGIDSEKEVLIQRDDPVEFANEIVRLLTDDVVCEHLSENSREYIRNYNEINLQTLYSIEEYIGDRV